MIFYMLRVLERARRRRNAPTNKNQSTPPIFKKKKEKNHISVSRIAESMKLRKEQGT